jgi:hypothetical protein
MIKIGKFPRSLALMSLSLFFCALAFASLQASIDRNEVPIDESVSLKISVGGDSEKALSPKFDAPDFEIMNQFQNSQYSSVYINGKFENKSENSITYILRPLKVGALRIRNITNAGERASDITIQVIQENAYKKSVSGEAPSLQGDAKNFFVKGEINKSKVFKGEQIIVSYYIYRRTRATVRDVMQYPSFEGFIREDLEMPILSGRPDFEAVNLGGVPFERALLARYAIYPIKDGKLKIDGFSVRVDYIPKNNGSDEMMEDPFFQFFTQVTPRTGTSKSDPITVDVQSVPEEGKSALFTGGVGDFDVSTQLDQTPIKANTPLTLHVSVKGKGNTSLIEFPKVDWPKQLKLYESQGKSKNLGQGNSEKVFDVVIVPLESGSLQIPPIDFEFFNPESRSYVRKKTSPIAIQVAAGDPGSASILSSKDANDSTTNLPNQTQSPSAGYGTLRIKDKRTEGASGFLDVPWWRWVSWFGLLVFFAFVGLVIWDQAKKKSVAQLEILKRKQSIEQFWRGLEKNSNELALSASPPSAYAVILETLEDELYKSLDEAFEMSSRATPKRELAKILTEVHGLSSEQWREMASVFEFNEMIRFSSAANEVEALTVGERVKDSIESAKKICLELSRKKLEKHT